MVLIRYLKVNRFAPLFTILWQTVFFSIGLLIVLIINTFFNDDPDFACIGSLMALVATAIGTLARGNTNGHVRFRLAVSMGNTRRSYLICDPIVSALNAVVGILFAWFAYLCETALYTTLYPGFRNDMPLDEVFSWQVILILIGAVVVMDLVMSAMMQRFGSNGFLAAWLILCGLFLLSSRAVSAYENGSSSLFAQLGGLFLRAITTLPAAVWIAVGAVIVLALVTFSVLTFRKAEAKL